MILPENSITKLAALDGKTNFEKMIGTVGILTELLGENRRPVIVGGLAVEIYTRNEYTTVDIDLILPDGMKVYVIGLENIILDSLRACVHWKSNSDCEWAQRLYFLHKQNLDIEYLRMTAKKDKTLEQLEKII